MPTKKISAFNGRLYWVGVTCNTTYEISSGGPFVHRRVLFKSTVPWPGQSIVPADNNASGGLSPGESIRATATSLSDAKLVGCLRRLFKQDTVRGTVQGPTASLGITVLKDETFTMRGLDDGVRREKKYWNSLKSEPMMQYNILPDGSFDFSLANAPQSQHLYLVDIYSYGLQGLDSELPTLQPSDSQYTQRSEPSKKRPKTEDTDMDNGVYSTSSMLHALTDPMSEDRDDGAVKISTTLKLYFKQA